MTIPVVGEEGAARFEIPPTLLVPPCTVGTPPEEEAGKVFFVKKYVYALVLVLQNSIRFRTLKDCF